MFRKAAGKLAALCVLKEFQAFRVRVLHVPAERLRIFISSPGDVPEERLRAHLVVQKLARDYARFFKIEAYLWEHEPMLASGHFQDAIEPPSACDVVVLIVYSRLGTPLPERTTVRSYAGLDGRAPVTGTEWEFEEALAAHRAHGAPDLLAYRKLGDPGASLADLEKRREQERQWDALESFWRRHFEGAGLFLAGSAKFHTLEEFDQKLEADLTALIERRVAQGVLPRDAVDTVWLKDSPFRGLAAYDFGDAPIFFGRDGEIRTALTRLQAAAEHGTGFLLVLGASGAGKSSFARAGLLPALFAPKAVPGVGLWRRVTMRPADGGDEPVLSLARALLARGTEGVGLPELAGPGAKAEQLATHLAAAADDPTFVVRMALDQIAGEVRRRGAMLAHEQARVVLLVDQLEELFTRQVDPARRDIFLRILAALARSGLVWVVATMRNDLWHRAAETPVLLDLVETGARLDLLPPDSSQLIEIIRRPAAAAGISFEVDPERGIALDATIAQAAAEQPGALPLVSVMLESLYERDIRGPEAPLGRQLLRTKTYLGLGELRGAIARRADNVMARVDTSDPEAAAALPELLRALVTTSARTDAVTSRPVLLSTFGPGSPAERLIAAFLAPEARLLVSSASGGETEIRLAHEALLENWPRARDQIRRDRRDLETRTRLEGLLQRWSSAAGPERSRTLLTGLNLAEGQDLVSRWRLDENSRLAAFVRESAAAESWRRRRMLVAAVTLLAVFSTIATVATLQWRRAESEAENARMAQATEREARVAADAERARAVEARRAAQKETAQTLTAQARSALARDDVRQALDLATRAGDIEADALVSGSAAASEPVLLDAIGQVRQAVRIGGFTQGWPVPFDFLDDATLVYADAKAGVVAVDLAGELGVRWRVAIPPGPPPSFLAVGDDVVAVSAGRHLLLIEQGIQRVAETLRFDHRIAALDMGAGGRVAAVAVGSAVAIVDLGRRAIVATYPVPEASDGFNIGQVRFSQGGKVVLASYGTRIFALDLASGTFSRDAGRLSGKSIGLDDATLETVLAKGVIAPVQMMAETGASRRVYSMTPLGLDALEEGGAPAASFKRDDPDDVFIGLSQTDQDRRGEEPRQTVAILSRSRDEQQSFKLQYVSGGGTLNDAAKLMTFESFSVPASDLGNEKPDACKVSRTIGFLACRHTRRDAQGLVVWRVLGGAFRFEREAGRFRTNSAVRTAQGVVAASDKGLISFGDNDERVLGSLPADWRIISSAGETVVAASPDSSQVQAFRLENGKAVAFSPAAGTGAVLDPAGRTMVVLRGEAVARVGHDGAPIWSAPVAGARAVAFAQGGREIAVATGREAYVVDGESGRILRSYPAPAPAEAPIALAPDAVAIAYGEANRSVSILDLTSGASTAIEARGATALAWSPDGKALFVGHADGTVSAWAGGSSLWSAPSPLDRAFEASAWPGQPPKGVVHQISVSPHSPHIAVVRQDLPAAIVYDARDGRRLTQLTPPWAFGVPAHLSFTDRGEIITAWAVHAMVRAKPSYVTVHRLPRDFAQALARGKQHLARLREVWPADAPPTASERRP